MPKKGFDENLEKVLCSQIVIDEYGVAKANQAEDSMDFEAVLDLLDSRRTEKEYEWMSDIRIPEFTTHVLTQASLDVSAYFRTRDFVEVYVEDNSEEAIAASEAAKECINRTLNQQHLNYYLKFVRSRMLNQLHGRVYAECWWNQETKEQVYGIQEDVVESVNDIHGNPITDRSIQVPGIEIQQTELKEEIPVIDRFEFDILDPRNVFTDNKYTYSLQGKDWVIIRSEQTLDDLTRDAERCGYFNLYLIEQAKAGQGDTETRRETYNADANYNRPSPKFFRYMDVLKRYGKFWCVVTDRDPETEAPVKVKPGIDVNGEILKNADLVETIITVAMDGGTRYLIGFQPTPYISGDGVPYRPIIRGMCYPHPVEDGGFGDGKHSRELQIAIDDTFNISMDRTKLATIPTFQVRRFSMEDNDSLYFEPGHPMMVNEMGDVQEFKITDNIQGALTQVQILGDKMQQLTSIYPTTMGRLPAQASTTATAVAGAESRTDMRSHFKALTMENTFDTELYGYILQMTYQFAKPTTGLKLMGEKVYDFDITRTYWYKPLSQSVETEYSKGAKLQKLIQFLQVLQPFVPFYANQPQFTKFVSDIMMGAAKYLGDEPSVIAKGLLNPAMPPVQEGPPGGGQPSTANQPGILGQMPTGAPSNQSGMPMSSPEMATRSAAGGAYQ